METKVSYDALGNIISEEDPTGAVTKYQYNAESLLTKVAYANNASQTVAYDLAGNAIRETDAEGNTKKYIYDEVNRLTGVTDELGNTTSYAYDAFDNISRVTDALGHVTEYAYDTHGNLLSETDALGNTVQYSYTPEGWLEQVTKADGDVIRFEYDKTGSLLRQDAGEGYTVTSSYNELGQVTEVSSQEGTITYQYNDLGRLVSVTNVNGDKVSYTWDEYGNKTGMVYPDGREVRYTYDIMGRMTEVTGLEGEVTRYAYDADGRRILTENAENTTTYEYDRIGSLIRQETTGVGAVTFTYGYNKNGYITKENRTENGATTESKYTYDAMGQLTGFRQNTGYAEKYTYDAAGNMLQKQITGTDGKRVQLAMQYNAGNQLTETTTGNGRLTYSYDPNGSMTSKTLTGTYGTLTDAYTYNTLDQLSEYTGYDGYRQKYTYDANGMRLSKETYGNSNRSTLEELLRGDIAGLPEVIWPGTQEDASGNEYEWATEEYLYDITQEYYQVIAKTEKTANEENTTAYAYGLERIAAYEPNQRTKYVYDGRGSVAKTISTLKAGETQEQNFLYTAFGEQMSMQKVSGFGYNAEAYDAATGMINLRARQYEPAMGRFEQKDIIAGSVGLPSSQHRYTYVMNNSVMFVDPSGMQAVNVLPTAVKNVTAKHVATSMDASSVLSNAIKNIATKPVSTGIDASTALKNAANNVTTKEIQSATKKAVSVAVKASTATAIRTAENVISTTKRIYRGAQEKNNVLDQTAPENVKNTIIIDIATCELDIAYVNNQTAKQKEHEEFMFSLYGFEKEEVRIMDKIRDGLKAFNSDFTSDEIDWIYTRAIGRLVYGNSSDSLKDWAEMMMWDGTVTIELIPEEQLFTNVIGLSQQEYKLLRYKVRVQNQILSAVETMSYTALLNYPDILAKYWESMEIALGRQLSDPEFERLWTDQYNAMSTASDYAHYNITKAAIFATDYPPYVFDVIEWIKRQLANLQTGGSDSTREDMAGWLGDATIRTNNGKVAFSQDDYKADLDADNVMNIMKTQNISHSEAEAIYFKRLENGETRAEIFLSHTSLDFVISEVMKRLNIHTLDELKTIEPEAYVFIISLEHGSNELEVVP